MTTTPLRERLRFPSGNTECAAWHYPGTNGACVLMAGGLGVPKEPGTDRFAARFHAAGYSVLAFDFRNLGESGGSARLVQRVRDQLADWDAAIAAAGALPEVDPSRLVLWAFSAIGGQLIDVALRHPQLGAVIAQSPNMDALATSRNAARFTTRRAMVRLMGRALRDGIGGRFGRPPLLVPLVGPRGDVALLSTPDALAGPQILDPDGRYRDWERAIGARTVLGFGRYRPGRRAKRVSVPMLIVSAEDDRTALFTPSARAAEQAPRGELLRIPGGHYAPFLDQHERVVSAEIAFLQRHL